MVSQVKTVMEKELSRKEFLAAAGLGVISLMGLSTVFRLITGKTFERSKSVSEEPRYNTGNYGG